MHEMPMNPAKWSVAVEQLDAEAARKYGRPDVEGQLGIVVRHDGRFVRVDAARDEIPPAISMEKAGRAVAEGYGFRFVPPAEGSDDDA